MTIERIGGSLCKDSSIYTDISTQEIIKLAKEIVNLHKKNLAKYGVKKIWTKTFEEHMAEDYSDEDLLQELSAQFLQLIFLYKYKGKLVSKDLIAKFVGNIKPNAARDQQVRHLGGQFFYYVLVKNSLIPGTEYKVPSGYYLLVSMEEPNPKIVSEGEKRKKRLSNEEFEKVKRDYHYCCATCGRKEGLIDPRMNGVAIKLQQGHMDPSKPLGPENVIPQCQYCNQTTLNNFEMSENGTVKAIANPNFVLRSLPQVKLEMSMVLLRDSQTMKSFVDFLKSHKESKIYKTLEAVFVQ